jgi:predicted dienelactone hydrolase
VRSVIFVAVVALMLATCTPHVPPAPVDLRKQAAPPPNTASRPPVGVTTRIFVDADRGGRELATTIWYPAADGTAEDTIYWDGIFPGTGAWNVPLEPMRRKRPLALLSHGSGGDGSHLAWLAEALASHGYVAAAMDHPGDRFGDSTTEGRIATWRRAADMTTVLTGLLADPTLGPAIDSRRVVAAGHSGGAATVLALAGARLQPAAYFAHCQRPGAGPDCALFDGLDPTRIADAAAAGRSLRDRRVRAVAALAPVLGPGMSTKSLRAIAVPVLLVAAQKDELVPFAQNADRYRRLIPRARLTTIAGAGHFVFMPVCTAPGRLIAANVCVDRNPDVDRSAVHARTAAEVIAFFDRALAQKRR